ncbi:NUDIX hydrolase [Geofilum sp. OHC36d9]|uniref:NUDIX hydrolase n=1 Tax=Geofilum sp. OHC36d9 TaxID=3458413 RepID=UPI004033A38C
MTHPSEVIKYCPRCGSGKFPAMDFKSFKCDDCGFHFFINSAAAVAALIVNDQNELLLTYRAFEPCKGMLDLPGGFVDPGEAAEVALRREVKEELNLEIAETQYLGSFPNEYIFSGYSVFTTDFGFICKVADFGHISPSDDVAGYEFFAFKDIDYDAISSASIRRLVKIYEQRFNIDL